MMKSQRIVFRAAVCLVIFAPLRPVRAGAADVEAVLRLMPADSTVSIVVVDFEKLDKTLAAVVKSIKPDAPAPEILADVKRELGIADWIDFTKPVGMGLPTLEGNQSILWAVVPGFAEKVKTVATAKEEDGVWHMTFEGKKDVYAKAKGGYVIASQSKEGLALATKEGMTLADELKTRMDLLTNRDALIHLNFDPIRSTALGTLAQSAQMAPMFGMMLGQKAGGDPMAITGLFTGIFDGLKNFAEQVTYLDITVGLTETAGNLTLATGYKDGAIKSYLAKQKPASVAPLAEIEDQPYFLAMGCHFPGGESQFTDYLFEKMTAAAAPPPGAAAAPGATGGSPASADNPASAPPAGAAKDAVQYSRDLYRKVEGWNSLIAMSPDGMKESGDYLGGDTQGILELAKKRKTQADPFTKSFSGGASYESLGNKKIGDASVEQFAVKFDTTNPAAAHAAQIMGESSRFSLGAVGGRVRYCMGSDQYAQRVFSAKVEKSLAANKAVAEAIAALPAKRNAVLLIDPVGILPMIGPMLGMPKVEPMPPGPPVAVSVSLSGEPARVDLHIPFKEIERMVTAFSPQQPM